MLLPLVLDSVTDDQAQITGPLTDGASTNDTDLAVSIGLSGTGALAGDTIRLFDRIFSPLGSPYVLTDTDISNGSATVQTGLLHDGSTYNLTASLTGAGNTSPASNSFAVTIDTTAPIVTASQAGGGNLSNGALTGTAEANGTITVRNGSTVLGTTTAAADGSWSYTPTGLTDGSYTLTAAETDAAGNTGTASASFVLPTKVTAITAAPSVAGPLGVGRSVVFTLTTSRGGGGDRKPGADPEQRRDRELRRRQLHPHQPPVQLYGGGRTG